MDIKQIYQLLEARKMKTYNNRIIQVQRGTFTPLIYLTSGGWALKGQDTTRGLLKSYPRRGERIMQLSCVTCGQG
jgi:hypothetical protein